MRTEEEHTGIFIHRTAITETWKEIEAAMEALTHQTILDEFEKWERVARQILRERGFAKFPCNVPKSAPVLARDAHSLMYEIIITRDCIKNNDALWAAASAFRAGHIATRIMVRPAEKSAVTGSKSRAYMAKLREARNKKVAAKHDKIISLFNELRNQYEPTEIPSDKKIMRDVSASLRVKFKTVESAIYRARQKSAK